jgi:hypothetical protein
MTASVSRAHVPALQSVLDRFRAGASAYLGLGEVRLEPVRHQEHPFSHVTRVAVCSGVEPPRHIFVKLFKPKPDLGDDAMRRRVRHEFDVTARVHAAMAEWRHYGTVKPLACYPDLLAIVTEEAAGATLLAHLDAQARWFPTSARLQRLRQTAEAIGGWLRAFQQIDHSPGAVPLHDLRDYVEPRLERLVRSRDGELTDETAERVLQYIDTLGSVVSADDLREVSTHADFGFGNILVDGDRIVVLDLAMMRRGVRVLDLARLVMQLDLLVGKPVFRPQTIAALRQALMAGFDATLTPADPLFRIVSMLHRINHLSTLVLKPEGFVTRLYSSRLIAMHRRWIERELASVAAL